LLVPPLGRSAADGKLGDIAPVAVAGLVAAVAAIVAALIKLWRKRLSPLLLDAALDRWETGLGETDVKGDVVVEYGVDDLETESELDAELVEGDCRLCVSAFINLRRLSSVRATMGTRPPRTLACWVSWPVNERAWVVGSVEILRVGIFGAGSSCGLGGARDDALKFRGLLITRGGTAMARRSGEDGAGPSSWCGCVLLDMIHPDDGLAIEGEVGVRGCGRS
jgi:hypothetical protein